MKKLTFTILSILLILCSINSAKAGLSISEFRIPTQYLNSNLQFVGLTGAATPFTANFTVGKAGNSYNTAVVSLILMTSTSSTVTVLSTSSVTRFSGDWGNSPVWESSISGILPAGIKSGSIYLQMTVYEGDTQGAIVQSVTSVPIYSAPPSGGNNVFPVNDPRYIKPGRLYNAGVGTIAVNGTYHLDFQTDGNLVLYKDGYYVLWAADISNSQGATLEFRTDGLVRIFNNQGKLLWTANPKVTNAFPNCYWVLQADGNFVGYESYRTAADGTITSYGSIIGSTDTQGGNRSNRYATL